MKPLQIGVCSWSLRQPDLATALKVAKEQLGLSLMQVGFFDEAVLDASGDRAVVDAVQVSGVEVSATCVGFVGEDYSSIDAIAQTGGYRPDDQFAARLAKTIRVRDLTVALGAPMMTTHIGFVPAGGSGPAYVTMVERLKRVCDALDEKGIVLTMETGQESAEHLMQFIEDVDRRNIRVNFDPANMVLYGVGDPVEAVGVLGERIAHVHCKDAKFSDSPGKAWGQEVPLGEGEANVSGVLSKLRQIGYTGPLVIEREGGDDRIGDVRAGISFLQSLL